MLLAVNVHVYFLKIIYISVCHVYYTTYNYLCMYSSHVTCMSCMSSMLISLYMGVEPKIGGTLKTPKSSIFNKALHYKPSLFHINHPFYQFFHYKPSQNKVLHYFHHPFWG